MARKRIKKALKKVKKAVSKRRPGDRLPDLPFPDVPMYGPLGGLLGLAMRNPYIPAALGAYALAENTERFWGPPVERQAQWTAKQWEDYQDWYERNIRAQYAGSEVPYEYTRTPQSMMRSSDSTFETPVKRTRKVTKANQATKMAWNMLKSRLKGKLTKNKCQTLLKKCSLMASKANPNTKSRIGKANNQTCKDCKKIRKSIWGTTKRY